MLCFMVHTIPHDLSPEAVRQTLQAALGEYQARYPAYHPELRFLSEERAELSFQARGRRLHGTVDLLPGRLVIDFKVPLLFRVFEGRVRQIVDREVTRWLAGAARGAEAK
jgi:hypothetical protein